jgi:hypothetical protein
MCWYQFADEVAWSSADFNKDFRYKLYQNPAKLKVPDDTAKEVLLHRPLISLFIPSFVWDIFCWDKYLKSWGTR